MNLLSRHVQVNNEGAIKFYEKFGFSIVERKQNYYKRIEPADAFVLQKTFKGVPAGPVAMSCTENSCDIKDSLITTVSNIPSEEKEKSKPK